MSDAMDRFKARKEERTSEPFDDVHGDIDIGALSDTLAKFLPLGTGVATEFTVDQLKDKEKAEAAKAAASSPAGQAQAAAKKARQEAAMAAADAITEIDPAGAKHQTAATAELAAKAAEQKAAFFTQGAASGAGVTAMSPMAAMTMPGGGGKSIFTLTNGLIALGVLVGGVVAVKLIKGKK